MVYALYLIDENKKYIFDNWLECSNNIKGKKARYKKFKNEMEAKKWLDEGANYETYTKLDSDAIYFDAGTGRGIGVEVRVTNHLGASILNEIMPKEKINEFGNYLLAPNRTNNFGELCGLFIALKYAKKYKVKKIYGDSELVIKYWSKRIYNEKNLEKDTIKLIIQVSDMYSEFIQNGGELKKISGDINPSDLGFHK
ncbi:RNase H1/viroplasmin domain-containing protein [Oceanivirga miroungae]|uniref:Ribonuclease H1 N-terminal domain-containing protein n=1 Tax=Oceanivirga miroungae TaxID=1130046 RepID=A0A6I8M8P5_9FUSO|nr:RNase H1/viroplasmin domain-containing protein [Oceanivirga miroungae]VWL85865.1 hypothetical protein OMES3154_01150 [Oceanivirga miroungae]